MDDGRERAGRGRRHQEEQEPGGWGMMGVVAALAGALVVFGGLAGWMWVQQREAVESAQAAARLSEMAPSRPVAEVTAAVAAMKLVTVEIDTKVRVQRGEASWRGDVVATVEYPVRLSYGVDLSKLNVADGAFSPLSGMYIIRVPRPMRIATEIQSERVPPEVKTGWLRLRSMAGEYYVSQARKDAPRVAADLELLPQDALEVERRTIEQVEKLVKTIVGEGARVHVRFGEDGTV